MYYVDYNQHGQINDRNRIVPTNVQADGVVVTYEGQFSTKATDEINRLGLVSHTKIGERNTLYCESPAAAQQVATIVAANPCYERR